MLPSLFVSPSLYTRIPFFPLANRPPDCYHYAAGRIPDTHYKGTDVTTLFAEVEKLRREWQPKVVKTNNEELCLIGPIEVVTKNTRVSMEDVQGIYYQRCGGGRRVVRKKIGGD